ncbi:DNA mismatch repair protein [Perkinsela sp. CCAP 1560/4]|nr:DNA mismatch repair protein [Perkinsela sp. CCAP 1560/4]|eukprot:KNH02445.1 DNA mismatch repair protein [Perkinsela sp. CCAP 1560/4]
MIHYRMSTHSAFINCGTQEHVSSVAFRCLKSNLAQEFRSDHSEHLNAESITCPERVKKHIEIILKTRNFPSVNGKTVCIYSVHSIVNCQIPDKLSLDTLTKAKSSNITDSVALAQPLDKAMIEGKSHGSKGELLRPLVSLIPKSPWRHEDMVKLSYLAALRFAFPTTYFSLVSSVPSLGPVMSPDGGISENGSTDVYTPLVRYFLLTEPTLLATLRKLLHSLHQVAESVDLISENPLDLRVLSLVIFSEAKVDICESPTDISHYERLQQRAMSDAGAMPVVQVSGVSFIAGTETFGRPAKGKISDRRVLKLTSTTNCPDVSWYLLYAEALRLVDPLLFRIFLKLISRRTLFRRVRVEFGIEKTRSVLCKLLEVICGARVALRTGETPSASDSLHKWYCSAVVTATRENRSVSAILHHVTGRTQMEAILQMNQFILCHYITLLGTRKALTYNNLYVSNEKRLESPIFRALNPTPRTEHASQHPILYFLTGFLKKSGISTSITAKEDASLYCPFLWGRGGTLSAVILKEYRTKTDHPSASFVYIGDDYESCVVSVMKWYLNLFVPRHAYSFRTFMANQYHLSHNTLESKTASATIPRAAGRSVLSTLLDDSTEVVVRKRTSPQMNACKYVVYCPSEAHDQKCSMEYDPSSILRGHSEDDEAKPALRCFLDIHLAVSTRRNPSKLCVSEKIPLEPMLCLDSIRPFASRLIQRAFSPSVVLHTFVYYKNRHAGTTQPIVERYMTRTASVAADHMFSGFAWVTIDSSESDSALRKFLSTDERDGDACVSLLAAVHNAHSHDECSARLDVTIVRNVFPEIHRWMTDISRMGLCRGVCLSLPQVDAVSFLPRSDTPCRLDVLRQCVAAYFGCERLSEVAARTGCLFDIHLLHPKTKKHTGLSFVGASLPVRGLQNLYESILFSNEHEHRFQDSRKRFIAQEAAENHGRTHRAAGSLLKFVGSLVVQNFGMRLQIIIQHIADRVEARAVAVNSNGQHVELICSQNFDGKSQESLRMDVALTVCKEYFPSTFSEARRLHTVDTFRPLDQTPMTLKYKVDLRRSKKMVESLPEPLQPCVVDRLLGALRARPVGSPSAAYVTLSIVIQPETPDDSRSPSRVSVILANTSKDEIASDTSQSPLRSALVCCANLLSGAIGREWEVSKAENTFKLRLVKPFDKSDLRLPLASLKIAPRNFSRLLRHCTLYYFGLEIVTSITRRQNSRIVIRACGAHRGTLQLLHRAYRASADSTFRREYSQAIRLHFPDVMEQVGEIMQASTGIWRNTLMFCAYPPPSYTIPRTNHTCTLQLMRTAFASAYHYQPIESVRISCFDARSITVSILDDHGEPMEKHVSRSLPFSLMECYGSCFKRNIGAMAAFEALERAHSYNPPDVSIDSDGERDDIYQLLSYIVRYELGLETIYSVEPTQTRGSLSVRVVVSAVASICENTHSSGEELVLGTGWHPHAQVARRFASLIALQLHFPLYFAKHALSVTAAENAEMTKGRAAIGALPRMIQAS